MNVRAATGSSGAGAGAPCPPTPRLSHSHGWAPGSVKSPAVQAGGRRSPLLSCDLGQHLRRPQPADKPPPPDREKRPFALLVNPLREEAGVSFRLEGPANSPRDGAWPGGCPELGSLPGVKFIPEKHHPPCCPQLCQLSQGYHLEFSSNWEILQVLGGFFKRKRGNCRSATYLLGAA